MQIRRVKLRNFRQFYGQQELAFPQGGTQNVTLIHAENGFGKTSILNAVLWCLFRDTTPRFERPEDIVNYDALEEGATSARVDVEVEDKGQKYLIQRTFDGSQKARDKTELQAYRIESGSLKPLPAPESFVGSIIPREMAKYFFFDGEAAESFAAAHNFKKMNESIRSILGCALADTAIEDLKNLAKSINNEIGETTDDADITRLESELSGLEEELEVAKSARSKKEDDIAALKEQHDAVVKALRDSEGAQLIQKNRDEKERRHATVQEELNECKKSISRWIGRQGVYVVSERLSKTSLEFVDEASLRGKIPSPYNEDFVKGLLESETCVCHRPLKPGTAEWTAVAELLKTASNAEVLRRVMGATSRSKALATQAETAPAELSKLEAQKAKLSSELTVLEQEIEQIGKKLEGLPVKELADRELSRKKLQRKIEEENQYLGGLRTHIVDLERQIEHKEKLYDELTRKNKKVSRLYAKRALINKAKELLQGLLDVYEKEARQKIEKQINDILEVVAHKDYQCRFNDDFSLELILNEKATPKSGGENQLLSLAFIASLVRFAADRVDTENLILKPGIVAPLVLDAPLGQLDPSYQESVAEFLPKLAQQVVLLVSGSQGSGKVLKALQPHVGAEYLLIQENRAPRGKKKQQVRVIHGVEREIVLYGQDHTMTQIEKIG